MYDYPSLYWSWKKMFYSMLNKLVNWYCSKPKLRWKFAKKLACLLYSLAFRALSQFQVSIFTWFLSIWRHGSGHSCPVAWWKHKTRKLLGISLFDQCLSILTNIFFCDFKLIHKGGPSLVRLFLCIWKKEKNIYCIEIFIMSNLSKKASVTK